MAALGIVPIDAKNMHVALAAGGERHRIYSGSAAHDMGDNGYCAVDDQIDVARFGATCEIGAVELEEHDSCCTATGCIEDISANECLAQHGDFRAGVGCNQMPFCSLPMEPSPVQVKKSSCCTPHGCLNNIAPAACEALNGTFRPGQACNQFPFCPVKQEPTKPGKFGKAGPGYGFTKQQTDTKTEYESDTAYQSKSVR